MFKKLLLCLVLGLALVVVPMSGTVLAESCKILKDSFMIVMLPDGSGRPMGALEDHTVTITNDLAPEVIESLNNFTNDDWTGGKEAKFPWTSPNSGVERMVIIMVQPKYLLDCK